MPENVIPMVPEGGAEQGYQRFVRLIKKPPTGSRVEVFTPDLSMRLLEDFNVGNRNFKTGKIKEYAQDMAEDRWALTGDTIKFSDQRLLDGQNRLRACIQAGVSFSSHVIFGLLDDTFDRIDKGKVRAAHDLLTIAGYKNAGALAQAVRWAKLIGDGRVKQRDVIEPRAILDLMTERFQASKKHGHGLDDYMAQARAIYLQTKQPIGMVCGMLYYFDRAAPGEMDEFADVWASGTYGGGHYKPLLLLQKVLGRKAASDERVHDVVRAALIITAWNLYIGGRQGRMTDFEWKLSDAFPKIAGKAR
jgi:hypothetical protein